MTEKRFTSEYNNQSDMIQYIDTQKEEPNRWSICNVSETLKKLNALHEENQAYLKEIRRLEDREKQLLNKIDDFQQLLDEEDKRLMNEFRCRCVEK